MIIYRPMTMMMIMRMMKITMIIMMMIMIVIMIMMLILLITMMLMIMMNVLIVGRYSRLLDLVLELVKLRVGQFSIAVVVKAFDEMQRAVLRVLEFVF